MVPIVGPPQSDILSMYNQCLGWEYPYGYSSRLLLCYFGIPNQEYSIIWYLLDAINARLKDFGIFWKDDKSWQP